MKFFLAKIRNNVIFKKNKYDEETECFEKKTNLSFQKLFFVGKAQKIPVVGGCLACDQPKEWIVVVKR